jgi:hypothetical protein
VKNKNHEIGRTLTIVVLEIGCYLDNPQLMSQSHCRVL